jgi:hypothetical protein
MLIVWVLVLMIMAFCTGCSSVKCEPKIVVQEVDVPLPCVVPIADLGDVELPAYPPFPGEEADDVELKHWALEVRRVTRQREVLLTARIEAMRHQVATHNAAEPKCADVE